MNCTRIIISLSLLLGLLPAHAENRPIASNTPTPEQCHAEIQRFEKVIGFIREAQGVQAASEIKEKMLPSKTAAEIMSREGPCGLAKHLRDKKLVG